MATPERKRELKNVECFRHRGVHRRESFFGVAVGAEEVRLVFEVVAEDEIRLRIEVRSVFRHQIELRLFDQRTVLDRRRAGQHGAADAFRSVRMNSDTQSVLLRFIADRIHLLLRHRRTAARANALRREHFHDVRSVGGELLHGGAHLFRRQFVVGDRRERGKNARSRQHAACYGVAQRFVDFRAERLHGGDAAPQCPPRILRRIQRIRLGRFAVIAVVGIRMAVGAKVPADVNVRVDAAGHQRALAEIDVDMFRMRIDRDDLVAVDDDGGMMKDVAATIDDLIGANGERGEKESAEHGRMLLHNHDAIWRSVDATVARHVEIRADARDDHALA